MSEGSNTGEGKTKEERRDFIARHVEQQRYISIEEITERFGVTTQTARRDILALEEAGLVRRLHGGATIGMSVDPVIYRQRRVDNAQQKARIGEQVAALIHDGAAVFIDTGTTCEAIAHALVKRRDLRIVTYSLRVAMIFSEHSSFALAVPGGFVRPIDGGVFREDTADFIKRFKFDYAVISVSGLDDDGDLCDDDHAEVAAVSTAIVQAERTILAVDSSKFGKRAMVRLGPLADVDVLVTDALPKGGLLDMIQQSNIEVHIAATTLRRVALP